MTFFADGIEMVTVECCICHIIWAITKDYKNDKKNSHNWFYCPNGHKQHYPQESREERLQRLLDQEQNCCIAAREEANSMELSLRAYKDVVTKIDMLANELGYEFERISYKEGYWKLKIKEKIK